MGKRSRLVSHGLAVAAICALTAQATGCNEHSVELVEVSGATEHTAFHDLGGGEKLDLLWMIDNSGSMCRSQEILRNGIEDFVDILAGVNLDFHIAVTTSHMQEEYPFEAVARPGHLQATPHPYPGFEEECHYPVYTAREVDEEYDLEENPEMIDLIGQPRYEALDPIERTIEASIECTEDPGDWQYLLDEFDEDAFRCDLNSTRDCDEDLHDADADYCTCPDEGADQFPNCIDCEDFVVTEEDEDGQEVVVDEPAVEDFFPPLDAFREIPLVLRSEDYEREDGTLDIESFRDDFACMSFVGTRGHGFEQGLNAVVKALSPEMTGAVEHDPQELLETPEEYRDEYPNAGFVRPDASTGVIFVSDENDCSHDGELDQGTLCSVHNCTINESRDDQGHLIPTEELAQEFKENIALSRGLDAEAADGIIDSILPASIHGAYQGLDDLEERIAERLDDVDDYDIPQQCPDETVDWYDEYFIPGNWHWGVPPSCQGDIGVAWSGHRYEYFLREFDNFFPLPDPDDPDEPLEGEICDDFGHVLEDIAAFFQAEAAGCIDNVHTCSGPGAACPPNPVTGQEGECSPYPLFDDDPQADDALFFCDSAIEVRIAVRDEEHTREDIQDTGYCIEDAVDDIDSTFDEPGLPADSCVVNPELYRWEACEGRPDGLALTWNEDDWNHQIGEFQSIIRYVTLSEDDD